MPNIVRRTSSLGAGCFLQGLGLVAWLGAALTLLTIIGPLVLGALGLWLILYGASISQWLECSDCGTRLSRRDLKLCPNCKGSFPSPTALEAIGLTPSALILGFMFTILAVTFALIIMSGRHGGSGSPSRSPPHLATSQKSESPIAAGESNSSADAVMPAAEVTERGGKLLLDAVDTALTRHQAKVVGTPTIQNIEAGKSWLVSGDCSVRDGSSVHFESLVRLFENGDYQSVNLILDDEGASKNANSDSPAQPDNKPNGPTQPIAQEPKAKQSPRDNRSSIRTWTSADGRFSTDAEFQGLVAGKVKLRRVDGSTINIDEENLSEADRKWIRSGRRK